jgi:hypothetical protein
MRRPLTILFVAAVISSFTGCIPAPEPSSVAASPTTAPPPSSIPTSQPAPTALVPVQTRFEDQGRVLYLDSGTVRLGIDTEWGGAIREIWFNGENVINSYDGGRLLAVSFYDSDRPPASNHPNDTGWNPTPSDMHNNANPPLEYSFAGNELYARARYIQWFPADKGGGPGHPVPTDIYVETWITFFGTPDTVRVSYRFTNEGQEAHAIASQEFPFAYIRTPFNRYVTYAGDHPWTSGPELVRDIPSQGDGGGLTVATERWAGFVNPNDEGLVLWAPQSYGQFSYAFFDNPGPEENSTFYLLPRAFLAIPPGYTQETQVFLLLGNWRHSRDRIYELSGTLSFADIMPCFGTIDAPGPGATVSDVLAIDGWAVDDHGVAEIEILLDGEAIGVAQYGGSRQDVDGDYPGLPNAPHFGFRFDLDTALFPNGLHILEVVAADTSGNTSRLRPGPMTIDIRN